MTPEMEALGRRALAAGMEWADGMLAVCPIPLVGGGLRVTDVAHGRLWEGDYSWNFGQCVPDLSDPATLGCIVAQAREALGEPMCWAVPGRDGIWLVHREDGEYDGGEGLLVTGGWGLDDMADFVAESSEPAAWVAALEAAKRRKEMES